MQLHQCHIQRIDHMGLVAGMCKEPGIISLLDSLVPYQSENRNISFGETVVSMLLNGLWFTARTLHMFPGFHADKPVDKLIRPGIEPEHINDSVLSRALDQLFELGVSEVYLSLAVKAVNVLKLPCKALNLDSTSFHTVEGAEGYESYEVLSDHANVPQRWLLIRSEQARKSEQKTRLKKMLKASEKEAEALTGKLAKKAFFRVLTYC